MPFRARARARGCAADARLVSIAVTSAGSATALAAGVTLALTATATYSNGLTADVTTSAAWSSGDTGAATVGAATGVVTGMALSAAAVITATLGGISGTKTLGVYADFTALTSGAVASMPAGLSFSRASSATVQTGTSTVVTTGIGTDAARAGLLTTGDPVALVIHPARTNDVVNNRNPTAAGWTALSGVTRTRPSGTAPDGDATTPTEYNGTGFSNYQSYTDSGTLRQYSMWVQSASGGSASARAQLGVSNLDYTATTSWIRKVVAYTTAGNNYEVMCNNLGGGQDVRVDMMQREAGGYPTDAVITTGASATRAGERLYTTGAARMVASNRLVIAVRLRADGSSSQYSGDGSTVTVWYVDSNNNASWNTSTRVLTITVGGSTNTCTLNTWSANDVVELLVAAGGGSVTVVKQRVNGGSVSVLTITGSALGTVTASTIDLLCQGTANQWGAHVETIYPYTPTWAA